MTYSVFPGILKYNLPKANNVAFEGNIDSKFLVIVAQEDWSAYQDLLTKILAAVNLDISTDVNILSIGSLEGFRFNTFLAEHTQEHVILSFGITANQLGLNVSSDKYRLRSIGNQKIAFVASLQEIKENQNEKKLLWEILKVHFTRKL